MTTRSRSIFGGVILFIVIAAYLAGFLPERQRRTALEAETVTLRSQASDLDDRVRLAQLHGQLLNVIDAVAEMNYGQAQQLASPVFDGVRVEAGRIQNREHQLTLEGILALRDEVTGALVKGDPSALEPLRRSERQLRQAIASPVLSAGPARN